MKTFKIEFTKAAALRKALLWSSLIWIPLVFMMGMSIAADITAGAVVFGIATVVTVIWNVITYWKALWALWEWSGIGLGLVVAICVFIMNAATGFLGTLASLAFLVYVYVQLGKQAGVPAPKREVFEET